LKHSRSLDRKEKEIIPNSVADLPKLDDLNAMYIRRVLRLTNGKVEGKDGAATILDIHPNTLRNRMKKLGIPYERYRRQNNLR
jgi:transcriptional regulator with GAF, ATPase, and Fis domain